MAIYASGWDAVRHSAEQFERRAPEIKRIEQDIELLRQGRKRLVDISPSPACVQARFRREETMLRGAPQLAQLALERTMARPDYQAACVLQRIVGYSRCVGRIMLAGGEYATGWLLGNFLKKDGNVYQALESDALIDWIANQGVRVSKIREALQGLRPQTGPQAR